MLQSHDKVTQLFNILEKQQQQPGDAAVGGSADHDNVMVSYATFVSDVLPQKLSHQLETIYQEGIEKYGDWGALMPIDPLQGSLLAWLTRLVNARSVLEIGTFTGYSTIYLANALRDNGVEPAGVLEGKPVVTCELFRSVAEYARSNFVKTGTDAFIDVKVGDAIETLQALPKGTMFDLIFIYADKPSYKRYFDVILERELLTPTGIMAFDNIIMPGIKKTEILADPTPLDNPSAIQEAHQILTEALDKSSPSKHSPIPPSDKLDELTSIMHAFNTYVKQCEAVDHIALPLFTGMLLVRLRAGKGRGSSVA
ncbi:hypothetical protein EV182_002370 [Spiromyces aspiralis]|uniref:Uncharacterized protein n=1 Tax=Spiromyces aspiralis TaxID=68401 RepID=A0ACC1HRT7_9FUNG|nr:hypothetical protein EV182_002370 [Spiromyces aspiralis]